VQLEHSFTVPVGIDDAWRVLLDIEKIAPCMPGAAIDSVDGDNFTGTVKVKLGPIGLTYKGKASFVEKDEAAHRTVIDARGRDSRGNGTANAKVTATLTASGGATRVDVLTDLDITGKPAQFGRGVMVDVGNKLIGQFADCLAGKLTDGALLDSPATSVPESPNPPQLETAVSDETSSTPKPRPRPRPRKAAAATASEANEAPAKAAPAKAAPAKAAKAGAATSAAVKSSAAKPAPAKAAAAKAATSDKAATAESPAAASATRAATTASVPEPDAPVSAKTAPVQQAAADNVAPVTQLPTRDTAKARRTADEVEPINLIESAGPALAKRLAPVLALLVLLYVVARRVRR